MDQSLFERIGGRPTLEKVHKIFYDKVYKHEWIGQFFKEIDQTTIENQQTDFMAQAMGGPKDYCGKIPIAAHRNMFITEELFTLRHQMLIDSLNEANVPPDLCKDWLRIDKAFERGIVKRNISDCERRFVTDEIMAFPNPRDFWKKSA